MSENTNNVLVETYKQLLTQLVTLQDLLSRAKKCDKQEDCELCDATSMCAPHTQLAELHLLDHNKKILQLEEELSAMSKRATAAEEHVSSLLLKLEEVPLKLIEAKLSAVAERVQLLEKDESNKQFIVNIAGRLGIHPDSTHERLKSAIIDTIRKNAK